MTPSFFEVEPFLPDVEKPYDTAIEMATKVAEKYVGDVSDWVQLVGDPVTRTREKDGVTYEWSYYLITFTKKINGFLSSEDITVKISSKGHLIGMMMGDIGAFDHADLDLDIQKLDQSVTEKVRSTYKEKGLIADKITIEDQRIAITPNGYVCIYSRVSLKIKNPSNTEVYSTATYVLTKVGKKAK